VHFEASHLVQLTKVQIANLASLGGGQKGRGGHPFLGERVGGGYHFFQLGRKKEHFGALLGHRRHQNARKLLKQAAEDHFELILGSLCDFLTYLPFLLFLVVFLPNRRIF
jgi:hypothetical protein